MSRPHSGPSLVRAVGPWVLAASIFNVTVGGGIFRAPGVIAGPLGAAAPLAYLVCAAAFALIVCCIAEAGSRVARTGGAYAYVETAFGPFAGFLTGALVWTIGSLALGAVASILAGNLGAAFPALATPVGRTLLLVTVFGAFAAVNVLGVKQGARLVAVGSIAKLLPLLALVVLSIPAIDRANLVVADPPSAGSLARASMVLVFVFAGIESAIVPSGEVREPARTVPRAVAIAMIGVTLLYLAIQVTAQGVLGSRLAAGSPVPLADVARAAIGEWGYSMVLVGATISMLAYVSGMVLALPRQLYAFAEDGFLPRALGAVHARWRTPWVAILTQAAISCAIAIASSFDQLLVITNAVTLVLYLGCVVAAFELRRRDVRDGHGTPVRLPLGPTIHILAGAFILVMLTSIAPREWALVGAVVGVAIAIYLLTRIVRRDLSPAQGEP